MSKKKSLGNSSFTRFLLLVVAAVLIYIGFNYRMSSNNSENQIKQTEYEKILSLDFANNYPQGPYEVIHAYYEMVNYIYGGECKTDEIPVIIEKQRILLSDELLKMNSYDSQVANCEAIVEKLKENDQKIIEIEQGISEKNFDDDKISYLSVTEFYNIGISKKIKYTLTLENDKWKIFRWDVIEEAK